MARPMKDGASYWPFDVDMLDDKKFKLIRGEFGVKGAYIALVLLNSVYKDKGYYKIWDADDCYLMSEGVGDGCSPKLVNEVLIGCVRRGLFNEGLFKMFGVLTSTGIQRRFFRMVKNSRNKVIVIREFLLLDVEDESVFTEGVLNKLVFKTVSQEKTPVSQEKTPVLPQENSLKEKEREIEIEIEKESKGAKAPRPRFRPPTVEEVKAYCDERGNGIDAPYFVDYYTTNGWVQGNGKPIKDWKACVRTWERNRRQSGTADREFQQANSEYEDIVRAYVPVYRKKGDGKS